MAKYVILYGPGGDPPDPYVVNGKTRKDAFLNLVREEESTPKDMAPGISGIYLRDEYIASLQGIHDVWKRYYPDELKYLEEEIRKT